MAPLLLRPFLLLLALALGGAWAFVPSTPRVASRGSLRMDAKDVRGWGQPKRRVGRTGAASPRRLGSCPRVACRPDAALPPQMEGATAPLGFFDPLKLSSYGSDATNAWFRQAEIKVRRRPGRGASGAAGAAARGGSCWQGVCLTDVRSARLNRAVARQHGRVAMAAFVGWIVTEVRHAGCGQQSGMPVSCFIKPSHPVGWLLPLLYTLLMHIRTGSTSPVTLQPGCPSRA